MDEEVEVTQEEGDVAYCACEELDEWTADLVRELLVGPLGAFSTPRLVAPICHTISLGAQLLATMWSQSRATLTDTNSATM